MIAFSRTLLVGGEFLDEETLRFHGILEDNIYAMELQVEVGIPDGRILRIRGRMKRYTTPVCPKAVAFLQKAVGVSLREENWVSKVSREVGQKGCQHFAEILIECGRCLDSALMAQAIEKARKENPAASPQETVRSWVRSHPEAQGACLARPRVESVHAD
jgi:Protein of unknown function (DUF2889)